MANHPEVPRPRLMVLRHTHVHAAEDPEGWRPAAEAISKFYRTFDAWFGNKTTPGQRVPGAQPGSRSSPSAPSSSWSRCTAPR